MEVQADTGTLSASLTSGLQENTKFRFSTVKSGWYQHVSKCWERLPQRQVDLVERITLLQHFMVKITCAVGFVCGLDVQLIRLEHAEDKALQHLEAIRNSLDVDIFPRRVSIATLS